jgi:hypothetical protein
MRESAIEPVFVHTAASAAELKLAKQEITASMAAGTLMILYVVAFDGFIMAISSTYAR